MKVTKNGNIIQTAYDLEINLSGNSQLNGETIPLKIDLKNNNGINGELFAKFIFRNCSAQFVEAFNKELNKLCDDLKHGIYLSNKD